MNKRSIIISSIVITTIIIGVMIYFIFKFQENKNVKSKVNDSTENVKVINELAVETSNEEDIRVSPNSKIILKQYYKSCGHTIEEEYNVPEDIVNMTKNQVVQYYNEWVVDEFSKDEIKIHKENTGKCNEHYIAKDTNEYIVIYSVGDNNKENIVKKTDISTKYLSEEDKERLKDGINIVGKENLNVFLEDFE